MVTMLVLKSGPGLCALLPLLVLACCWPSCIAEDEASSGEAGGRGRLPPGMKLVSARPRVDMRTVCTLGPRSVSHLRCSLSTRL